MMNLFEEVFHERLGEIAENPPMGSWQKKSLAQSVFAQFGVHSILKVLGVPEQQKARHSRTYMPIYPEAAYEMIYGWCRGADMQSKDAMRLNVMDAVMERVVSTNVMLDAHEILHGSGHRREPYLERMGVWPLIRDLPDKQEPVLRQELEVIENYVNTKLQASAN